MRDGLKALSNSVTATSDVLNATWPFFVPPHFETQANDIITQTRVELITLASYVDNRDRAGFENFTSSHYEEWVRKAHLVRYGNFDRLKPIGFLPYIHHYQGRERIETEYRDYYLPSVAFSPPPVSYLGLVSF